MSQASSLRGGADAAKPAAPVAKDVYLATDTKMLYVCVTDGVWTGFDFAMLIQGILTLYADAAGGGFEIKNIKDPTAAQSAATSAYVLAQLGSYLPLAGGTMTGVIAMGTKKITGVGAPALATDVARLFETAAIDAKLDDVVVSTPTLAMDTTYQNTSGKIEFLCVEFRLSPGEEVNWVMDSTSPPTTVRSQAENVTLNLDEIRVPISLIVPPSWYYKFVSAIGTPSVWYMTKETLF